MADTPPAVRINTIDAWGVFDQKGKFLTGRLVRAHAEEAAMIICGTHWASLGFTVDPIQITRFLPNAG